MKIRIILTVVCVLVTFCPQAVAQDSWWDKVKQEIKNTYEHYFPSKKPDSTVTVTESVVTGGVEEIWRKFQCARSRAPGFFRNMTLR